MSDEFREFVCWFDDKSRSHVESCECAECVSRRDARWMIRGALMFNDLNLAEDPWDYNLKNNR